MTLLAKKFTFSLDHGKIRSMDNTVQAGGQRSLQQPASQPTQPHIITVTPIDTPDAEADADKKTKQEEQISSPGKEFGPVMSASPSETGQVEADDDEDEIKVARQEVMLGTKVAPIKEVQIPKELQEVGVEQGADAEKEIPVVVQRAGMRVTAPDAISPIFQPTPAKLPINYAHALELDKRSQWKESIKWLARMIKREWEKMQFAEDNKTKV